MGRDDGQRGKDPGLLAKEAQVAASSIFGASVLADDERAYDSPQQRLAHAHALAALGELAQLVAGAGAHTGHASRELAKHPGEPHTRGEIPGAGDSLPEHAERDRGSHDRPSHDREPLSEPFNADRFMSILNSALGELSVPYGGAPEQSVGTGSAQHFSLPPSDKQAPPNWTPADANATGPDGSPIHIAAPEAVEPAHGSGSHHNASGASYVHPLGFTHAHTSPFHPDAHDVFASPVDPNTDLFSSNAIHSPFDPASHQSSGSSDVLTQGDQKGDVSPFHPDEHHVNAASSADANTSLPDGSAVHSPFDPDAHQGQGSADQKVAHDPGGHDSGDANSSDHQ
jgi:hypothetical protein